MTVGIVTMDHEGYPLDKSTLQVSSDSGLSINPLLNPNDQAKVLNVESSSSIVNEASEVTVFF